MSVDTVGASSDSSSCFLRSGAAELNKALSVAVHASRQDAGGCHWPQLLQSVLVQSSEASVMSLKFHTWHADCR